MHYSQIVLFSILSTLSTFIGGQVNHIMYDLQYDRGEVLLTNDFLSFDNAEKKPLTFYHGASLRVLFQSNGNKNWQRSLKLPYYGVGVGIRDFKTRELGRSYSAYGVLGIPLLRTRPIEFFTEIEYGAAFGWNHYDPVDNPYNQAIGSKMTVHAGARALAKIHLGKRYDLNLGASFLHFSNGRFERPNNGLNIATYWAGVTFYPNARMSVSDIPRAEKEDRKTEFAITIANGSHQRTEVLDNNYFSVAGLNFSFAKRHANLYQSRLVVDFNYFWSLTTNLDGSQGAVGFDNLTLGLMYQPEFKVGKFTLVGGVGVYARHVSYEKFSQLYQRLGVRYNIVDWLSVAYNVRSVNFHEAEFLEFQLGYHF